jgi:hypothetical protein
VGDTDDIEPAGAAGGDAVLARGEAERREDRDDEGRTPAEQRYPKALATWRARG